jgi:DNA-binding transcriptional regulator YhcF (GntR family)
LRGSGCLIFKKHEIRETTNERYIINTGNNPYSQQKTMPPLSIDVIFETAIKIQIVKEESLTIVFSREGLSLKLPTTRRLADELGIPHYYVLPYFAMMEQEDLVTRAERVGIMTTPKGTRKYIGMLRGKYREAAASLLSPIVFDEILRRMDA